MLPIRLPIVEPFFKWYQNCPAPYIKLRTPIRITSARTNSICNKRNKKTVEIVPVIKDLTRINRFSEILVPNSKIAVIIPETKAHPTQLKNSKKYDILHSLSLCIII